MNPEDENKRARPAENSTREESEWAKLGPQRKEILQLELKALRNTLCHSKSIAKSGTREGSLSPHKTGAS